MTASLKPPEAGATKSEGVQGIFVTKCFPKDKRGRACEALPYLEALWQNLVLLV